MRGAALIWSPLLRNTPRVSNQLAHIQDWLPTLLTAANVSLTPRQSTKLDGKDLWKSLGDPATPTYREVLITIDTERNVSALRRGRWKLVQGWINVFQFLYVYRIIISVLIFIEGTTWKGEYDKALGPSGREGKYNISAIRSSHVSRALAGTSRPLPTDETIQRLRTQATITCAKVYEREREKKHKSYLWHCVVNKAFYATL